MEGCHDFHCWTKMNDQEAKEEMCALGAASSEVCWFPFLPASTRIHGSQAGEPGSVPPTHVRYTVVISRKLSHPAGPPPISEMGVQRRVPPPLSDTFTFTAALAQHPQDLGETGSTDHQKKRKAWGPFLGHIMSPFLAVFLSRCRTRHLLQATALAHEALSC